MRAFIIILVILTFFLLGLLVPESTLEISVTELDNGIKIENKGSVACLVFVSSLDGEQRFELAIGQDIVVTDITKPIEVSAVSR